MTDPRITDEAVEAARRAREDVVRSIDRASDGTDWPDPMRAALEAALPYLQAQPVASRERVAEVLARQFCEEDTATDLFDALSETEQAECVQAMGSFADALLAAGVFREGTN